MDELDKSWVCVGLIECEVDLILVMGKVILEGKTGIVLVIMMIAQEVYAAEGDTTSAFQPPLAVLLPSLSGENGDEHPLTEERGFFDEIDKSKSPDAFAFDPSAEEKPVIIAIGIDIVLDHKVILSLLLITAIRSA